MMLRLLPLLLALLLAPRLAWAQAPGIQLYENGEYEAAAQLFTQALADPQRSPQERGLARVYLAASLHALGRVDEARQQLEVLAREHPEQRVDAVRFLPELVELAEAIRQRVETERTFAEKEAERERKVQEEIQRRPRNYLRPEALGLYEALGNAWTVGAGLAFHRGLLEGGARVMLNSDPTFTPPLLYPTFQLQGGLLLGSGALKPHVGLRATLVPGAGAYGGGVVAGARYPLPGGFVALLDVGAEYFFVADEFHHNFAVTAQAGLGFDLQLPSGP